MADIAVERVEVDVTNDGQTYTLSNAVDVNKAFVRIMSSTRKDSAGQVGSTGNLGPNDVGCGVQLTGSTQLTFRKQLTNTVKMMVEVWRYTGQPGGAYEFILRQQGSVSFVGSERSVTDSISGMTDRNDCIPFHCGYISAYSGNNEFQKVQMAVHLNVSDEIVFSRNNQFTGTSTYYYQVVEFVGSAWNVAHARSANHETGGTFNTGGEIVTLNTDSRGTGGSTFDIGDWSTAMIIQGTMEGDSVETGLSDTMAYVSPGTSTTNVRFTLDNTNSRNDGVGYVHVLQCADLSIVRGSNANLTEGNNSYGTPISITSSTPIDELSLEWFPGTNGEGTAHIRGNLHAQIIGSPGSYQIQHWIHRSGNNVKVNYGVVDLSALVDSGGASTTNIRSGSDTITKIYLGSQEITRAYLGSVLIHDV